jgi:hypothetical protein
VIDGSRGYDTARRGRRPWWAGLIGGVICARRPGRCDLLRRFCQR